MILILNTITNEEYRQRFESCVRDYIYTDLPVRDLNLSAETGNLDDYSHLLISGSGLSTVDGSEWESRFFEVISHFVDNHKAILGICYGHQLLAKYLGGPSCVRKSANPQFGFRRIITSSNELFRDIQSVYSMVAHFDEVTNLGKAFEIIAEDDEGVIQGFQYRDSRIWGLQFHPEYDYFNGLASWERKIRNNPEWIRYYKNTVPSFMSALNNKVIFENFIKL
ncbi:MAG: gamma-glutamyl-gamma-aminobutyrate hydrolase family protein [Candidatus Stygibacter australis]|nr:gamma-glutamyl-gamma-aminobutyrate hydrolase family protein [Candidatus Stygibacter australis]